MLDKQTINESLEVELALPKEGFSPFFLADTREICAAFKELIEGYVLLKKSNDTVSIFFCFSFEFNLDEEAIDAVMGRLTGSILGLFKDQIAIDAISLNGKDKLTKVVRSITPPPFFNR